jgi:EAL domain-containing protein (putative c-di-GMP-specific phosphodiesterase class I)
MQAGRQLIIVGNDDEHADRVADVASEHGFTASRAGSAEEFGELYSETIELVVLDLMMTRTDGIKIIRDLADRRCCASLIITGDADRRILNAAERLARARLLMVAGSLAKPLEEQALRRLLDHAVVAPGSTGSALNVQVAQTELLNCLEDGAVQVMYQPKIDVRTLEFVSVEALVRLQHPQYGLLEPRAFLALAEESGLIHRLTRSVLLKSLAQASGWLADGLGLQVAVNVSPLLLGDLTLPDFFADMADRYGIPRENIVLEITENWISEDAVTALDILTRLRMMGFQLSMDDFGTGYSTMSQLNELPFNELKLDQRFIRNAARDAEARAIVESSIELGHKLGMRVVAEGIEKQADWDLVSELRCDEGQGYFIARPMLGEEVPAWLGHWNACLGRS